MLGVKGVFTEGDAQIAASFASSTYVVPQVLLEIGASPADATRSPTARGCRSPSRSRRSTASRGPRTRPCKDSLMRGYAGKRASYSPFLAEVNAEIARTHDGLRAR